MLVKKQRNTQKWKPFFAALCKVGDSRRFYYFESQTAIKPQGIIDVSNCALYAPDDSLFGRPNCFALSVCGEDLFFCCNTEMDKLAWLTSLQPIVAVSNVAPAMADGSLPHVLRSLHCVVVEAKDFPAKITALYCIVSLNSMSFGK